MSGPYMNESGDWWMPVTVPFAEARREVVACLQYIIPDEGRLAYTGRETVSLTDHEYGCVCDPTCYREIEAWHFVERVP